MDAAAKVEIVDNDAGDLVSGARVGSLHAVNLCQLGEDNAFTIRVTAADGTTSREYPVKVVFASNDISTAQVAVSGAELDTEFSTGIKDYYLTFADRESAADITVTAPEGGGASVDGAAYTGPVQVSADKDFHTVTIYAADGMTSETYYFVTRLTDGSVPYFGISQETKDLARKFLTNRYSSLQGEEELNFSSYWSVFTTVAAGGGTFDENGLPEPYDFTGKYVYDVRKHGNRQATDPAACILMLVMLGENPYHFDPDGEGGQPAVNFVERLQQWSGGGAYANNVWYVMAAKAAGIETEFEDALKLNGLNPYYDLDTRSWVIAALDGILEEKEIVRYIDSLHDRQYTSGTYAGAFQGYSDILNLFTNGCVLTAIASANVDPERQFAVQEDGRTYTPMRAIENWYSEEDGLFISSGAENVKLYPKDMIIGAGDILHGSNVWARYALTGEKYEALQAEAGNLGLSVAGMPEYGAAGYGEAYYSLYEQVADAREAQGDDSMRPRVIWGMPYQLFEDAVSALPGAVAGDDLEQIKEAVDQYEALDDSNREAVSLETMTRYQAAVEAALRVKDAAGAAADLYVRILALPDPLLVGEKDRSEVAAIRAAYNGMTAEQQSCMDWAGASVLAKLGKAEAALDKGSGGGETPASMTIHFQLLGAPDDGEDGVLHTLKAGNLDTWLEKDYTFNAGSLSAERVFRVIMGEEGIAWRGDSNNNFGTLYISGVQNPETGVWMEEFTTTSNSGWMYTVNGRHPDVGMSDYTLRSGDAFTVHYTDDYTREEGSETWSGGGTSGGSGASALEPQAGVDEDGAARVSVTEQELKSAIADAKGSGAGVITVAPDISGTAVLVAVELPKAAVSEMVRQTDAALKVETPLGSITIPGGALAAAVNAAGGTDLTITLSAGSAEEARELLADGAADITRLQWADCAVIRAAITSGGKDAASLGGEAAVLLLPVTGGLFEAGESCTVYRIGGDGAVEQLSGTCLRQGGRLFAEVSSTHLGTFVVLPRTAKTAALPFTDVTEDDWFYSAVASVCANGLFYGTSGTAFSPMEPMTRAMLVTVLWRLEGEPAAAGAASFPDVEPGAWYAGAAAWACGAGIAFGTGDGFAPEGYVTREQIAVMLYRCAKAGGWDVDAAAELTAFTDGGSVSGWAVRAMEWACAEKLITGKDGGRLDPQGQATRAEVAVILTRLLEAGLDNA